MNVEIITILLQSQLIDVNLRSEIHEVFDGNPEIIEYMEEEKDDDDEIQENTIENSKEKQENEDAEEKKEESHGENKDDNMKGRKKLSIIITQNIILHFNYNLIKLSTIQFFIEFKNNIIS